MNVNFYLKDGKATREVLIYCLITYQNKRVKYYTNRKIHPKHWNPESHQARKSHPNSTALNNWLRDIKTFVAKIDLEWSSKHSSTGLIPIIPQSYLKEKLDKWFTKTTRQEREEDSLKSFWGFYEQFLTRMKNGSRLHLLKGTPMAPKTIFQFDNLKRHLENYQKAKKIRLDFSSIDLAFYNDFVEYLTIKLNLAPNTIGKLITNLKVFLREAFDEGKSTNNIFTNRRFKSINSEADTIHLTPIEINEMYSLDLSRNSRLERVRDMFIISCNTALRYSDIVKIRPEDIVDGMIQVTQHKTKKKIEIPIKKIVELLLSKYNYSIQRISNQKYNKNLKEIAKLCVSLQLEKDKKGIKGGKNFLVTKPKYEFVSSHTARRSFATNEYMLGDLNVQQIMSITGHTTERSFYKYIRQTPKENAERIRLIWNNREEGIKTGNLKAV